MNGPSEVDIERLKAEVARVRGDESEDAAARVAAMKSEVAALTAPVELSEEEIERWAQEAARIRGNPLDARSVLKRYGSEAGFQWQRIGPVAWQRELDSLTVSLDDFPGGVDQACEMNPPGHVVKPPPRREPLDLTDMGLRIVSWPTRDADGVIDDSELQEKTAALVDALKALESAAEAMPSGVGLRVRVEIAGQVVIGEARDYREKCHGHAHLKQGSACRNVIEWSSSDPVGERLTCMSCGARHYVEAGGTLSSLADEVADGSGDESWADGGALDVVVDGEVVARRESGQTSPVDEFVAFAEPYIGPHTCGGLRVLRLLVDERLPHVGPADECGRRRCLGCADCSGGEE